MYKELEVFHAREDGLEHPGFTSPPKFLTMAEVEKEHIQKALVHFKGNKTRTAKALGISHKTLYNKLHEYKLFKAD